MYETNSIAQRICISVEHEKKEDGQFMSFPFWRGSLAPFIGGTREWQEKHHLTGQRDFCPMSSSLTKV